MFRLSYCSKTPKIRNFSACRVKKIQTYTMKWAIRQAEFYHIGKEYLFFCFRNRILYFYIVQSDPSRKINGMRCNFIAQWLMLT